ncbi:recombinase family protein [Sorangium sp. So ce362]|uniref:recombinase family protein n=1 Tax=Sorangium sp. So ce362 TaxID=3133303 RepID=UPI003F5DD6A1
MRDKIQATHLERLAVVYLRQSTLRQVHDNHESTVRQYALGHRAIELGWPPERVRIVDDDLGRSGTTTHDRSGFQRLAQDVAEGRVGALFALEVSRLARSSADWHRLLDLCGLADVVIVDEQSAYLPGDPDDRLLLGLKGAMSEAEQYWMRLRLGGGKLSKARRGELHITPATGFVWDAETSHFRLDPDERVQRAVRLVLERFRVDGSAYGVLRYFERHGLQLPAFDKATGQVRWVAPGFSHILDILHNPAYAGAYVYGRRATRPGLVEGKARRRTRRLPESEWKICLRDHHPAYITWDEFVANQRKLGGNRLNGSRGPAREGSALLQGIVICGRCGRRMSPRYHRGPTAAYACISLTVRPGANRRCWSVSARAVDRAVAAIFLQSVHVPEIELALAVARETERQAQEVDRQWALRRERLTYDARLAERRYKAVDPDNRVVARTLERDWNEKLRELERLENEYQAARHAHKLALSEEDRDRILALTKDLTRVWDAPTTTHAERKNLLRMLVKEVVLSPSETPTRSTRIQVVWKTGAVTEVTVDRPRSCISPDTSPEVVERIRALVAQGKSDAEIANDLNRRHLCTVHDLAWNKSLVCQARVRLGIQRPLALRARRHPCPLRRSDGLYSIRGVAARLGVTVAAARSWVRRGQLRSRVGGGAGRARWFELDRGTLLRLRAAMARGNEQRERLPASGSARKGGAS